MDRLNVPEERETLIVLEVKDNAGCLEPQATNLRLLNSVEDPEFVFPAEVWLRRNLASQRQCTTSSTFQR